MPELTRAAGNLEIGKKRYSAFFGTNLDRLIAGHAIDTVVLAGVNTHACIRVTAIDAYQRDLAVILAREAIGSSDEKHAEMSLRYMDGKIARVLPLREVVRVPRGELRQEATCRRIDAIMIVPALIADWAPHGFANFARSDRSW